MFPRFKATCERVRRNNGVVEALFTLRADAGNPLSQESHTLVNVPAEYGEFTEGRDYWVQIQPAFPY